MNMRSVGVMGDERTYDCEVALHMATTRIVNEGSTVRVCSQKGGVFICVYTALDGMSTTEHSEM